MAKIALTTIDNPYNPHSQFDEWYQYDIAMGYDTCGYLARVTISSDDLSDAEQEQAERNAINDILRHNLNGMYTIVANNATQIETKDI